MNKKPPTSLVASKAKGTAKVCGLALASILLPGVSWAQAQTQAPAAASPEQIIVTGTRLPNPNLVSTSPIQIVSAQEISISGKNDVVDILALLPQAFTNDLGQDLGNRTSGLTTAGGVSTADLRGLGPNRTLVLVNGRRLGVGSPYTAITSPAPDLDQIPSRLVERVEVVTGGASAIYGADAVAGVVNFILKRDFEGVEFEAQTGFNVHDNGNSFAQQLARDAGFTPASGTITDGRQASYSLIAGANSANGKGNFTAYIGYQNQDPIRSGNRDFGAGQLFTDTDDDGVPTGTVSMAGSTNSNRFQPKAPSPAAGRNLSVSGTSFVTADTVATTPPYFFNSQQYIYMTRQYKRANAGVIGHYDLNDHVQPYMEFGFMDDKTHQEIAPSALFRGSNPITPDGFYRINCSNPLLSAQQRTLLCTGAQITADTNTPGSASAIVDIGRRNIEGGGRQSDYEHGNYRALAGLKGELTRAWSYDAYAQYYYVKFNNADRRYLSFDKITNALQVTTPAGGGAPVCISGPPCVPYNMFRDGAVTQDQLAYLYTDGTGNGSSTLRIVHADFTADFGQYGLKLGGARDGVALNVGVESRSENLNFSPDEAEKSGMLSGRGGAAVAIDRDIDVDEYFAEIRVPLLQDKKRVYDLSLDAGFRHSDYSVSGGANTSKFEIQYAPTAGTRLRTSINRAIRAPSIIELFNPQSVGQITIGADPCAPPAIYSLQQCLRTVRPDQAAAFTAAYNAGSIPQGTASQLSQLQSGNELLKPEQADTFTLGVTLTPARLKRFSASIDYWNVKLKDGINPYPAGAILNGCPLTGDPVFCAQLIRHPLTFSLNGATVAGGGYIDQTSRNVGAGENSGIDLQGNYRLDLQGRGSLNVALAGSYMLASDTTPYTGGHTYDCTGLFGLTCQTVNPKWRHIVRLTWAAPSRVSTTLSWRYISQVKEDNNDADPTLHNASFAGFDPFNAQIGAHSYFDLTATYQIKKIELRGGINNIADKDPPFLGSEIVGGGSPNTYALYDVFGRQAFLAFNVKF